MRGPMETLEEKIARVVAERVAVVPYDAVTREAKAFFASGSSAVG